MRNVGKAVLTLTFCASALAAQTEVRVLSPHPDETRHDNSGNVPVVLSIEGQYAAVRTLVDGKAYPDLHRSSAFTLTGLDRGEHTIQIELLDRAHNVVAASEPVTFYVWQASRLFPNRAK